MLRKAFKNAQKTMAERKIEKFRKKYNQSEKAMSDLHMAIFWDMPKWVIQSVLDDPKQKLNEFNEKGLTPLLSTTMCSEYEGQLNGVKTDALELLLNCDRIELNKPQKTDAKSKYGIAQSMIFNLNDRNDPDVNLALFKQIVNHPSFNILEQNIDGKNVLLNSLNCIANKEFFDKYSAITKDAIQSRQKKIALSAKAPSKTP